VAGAVLVGELALQDEGHGLEAAMGMRPERQAVAVRRIDLRAMVVEKQEGIDLVDPRTRHRPARDEVGDVVALGGVDGDDGLLSHINLRPLRPCDRTACLPPVPAALVH
jgi:hypothetical protein